MQMGKPQKKQTRKQAKDGQNDIIHFTDSKSCKKSKRDSETTLIDISWCISQSVNQALDDSFKKEIRNLNRGMRERSIRL